MRLFLRRAVNNPLRVTGVLWTLALLAPFAPLLPKTSGLPWRQEFVLAALLVLTLALLAKRTWRPGDKLSLRLGRDELAVILPLLLFVLWSAASATWAVSIFPALHHTFVWGAYLIFFLLMRRVARSPRLLRASFISLAGVIWILALACALEFWLAPNDIPVRSDSLFRYFNGFGEMMAVAVPLFTALALRLRRPRAALFCGATAVFAWLAMFQALERAPIIGACVALLLLAGVSTFVRRFRPRSLKRVLLLLAGFGAATALLIVPSPLNEGRVSAADRLQSTSTSEANTRVRFLFWGIGVEMWREHPLTGVGASNYDTAYPEARAQFSARHPDSDLIAMDEEMLVERAHNEYVQILAELGAVGFIIFVAFCAGMMLAAWRALRYAQSPLALGAVCSLTAFALSSGASSASFRWMGGGLIFFFAAALVSHFSSHGPQREEKSFKLSPAFLRTATITALVFSLIMLGGRTMQAASVVVQGRFASAETKEQVDDVFRRAIAWNPLDAPLHFNYGMWLYQEDRASEAVSHLRYAVERGFNASVCYAYLAAAEAGAGDLQAAEQTLAQAARVYPRSIFLRVRHASALAEVGRAREANEEYLAALRLNSRVARGWRQLICFGRKAAKTAAFWDKSIAMAGELFPENCIFAVLDENEKRQPVAILEEDSPLSAAMRQGP
ncbi:MAG TPA: O-antigen ligase family protein [Pyrinomonadaceae bacterium]|nr:O-antigen ligase family protein [Pyrinomonadaceae bacterium]